MADITFSVTLDVDNSTLTFKGSCEEELNSLSIYIKGEDKDTSLYTIEVTDSGNIAAFLNPSTGLVVSTVTIFGDTIPDNYYLVEMSGNTGVLDSERRPFIMLDYIKKLVQDYATSVNIPLRNILTMITYSMMLQVLELLELISIEAEYTYDRENRWRKSYNYLIAITDVNQY